MSYEPNDDEFKLIELRYRLWHDIEWKLNKIRYSMAPPKPANIGLGGELVYELDDVISEVNKMQKDIEAHVKSKARIKKLLEKLEKLEELEKEDGV